MENKLVKAIAINWEVCPVHTSLGCCSDNCLTGAWCVTLLVHFSLQCLYLVRKGFSFGLHGLNNACFVSMEAWISNSRHHYNDCSFPPRHHGENNNGKINCKYLKNDPGNKRALWVNYFFCEKGLSSREDGYLVGGANIKSPIVYQFWCSQEGVQGFGILGFWGEDI